MGTRKPAVSDNRESNEIDWDSFFSELAATQGQGITVSEIAHRFNVGTTTAREAVRQQILAGKMRYAGRGMRRSTLDGALRPVPVYAVVEQPKGKRK